MRHDPAPRDVELRQVKLEYKHVQKILHPGLRRLEVGLGVIFSVYQRGLLRKNTPVKDFFWENALLSNTLEELSAWVLYMSFQFYRSLGSSRLSNSLLKIELLGIDVHDKGTLILLKSLSFAQALQEVKALFEVPLSGRQTNLPVPEGNLLYQMLLNTRASTIVYSVKCSERAQGLIIGLLHRVWRISATRANPLKCVEVSSWTSTRRARYVVAEACRNPTIEALKLGTPTSSSWSSSDMNYWKNILDIKFIFSYRLLFVNPYRSKNSSV